MTGNKIVKYATSFQFLLEPDDSVSNGFNCFSTVSAASQVVSQLIIAEHVTGPVAEVILKWRHMMAIGVLSHMN